MSDDDQPPEHIWLDPEALSQHFDRVRERYKSGSAGQTPIGDQDLDTNELTRELMRG